MRYIAKRVYESKRVYNRENKFILTRKHGKVAVKCEHQSVRKNCNSGEGFHQPLGKMVAPNCRDAVGFSGGECHVVTSPNHPPWRENTAYWPRVHDDVIIPPKSYKSTCNLIPRYPNCLDSGKNTSRLVFR